MPLLEALGLQKRFGGIHAVNNVNFKVEMGEIIGLIGPNGSGKSTLLGLLMGVHKPNSGTIRFAGEEIQNWTIHKRIKNGIAIVFQHSRPLKRQTVLDNIKLAILPDRLFSFYYRVIWKQKPGRSRSWSVYKRSPTLTPPRCHLGISAEWNWPRPWPSIPGYCS